MFQLPIEVIIRPNMCSYIWSHDRFDRKLKCLAHISFERHKKFSVISFLNFVQQDDPNENKETEFSVYPLKHHTYLYNSHSSKVACIHIVVRLQSGLRQRFSVTVICLG